MENSALPIGEGDIVRLEVEDDGTWFYCRVESLEDSGDVLCSVVDAQSWPSVALSGLLPGREYRIAAGRVLSIVEPASRT